MRRSSLRVCLAILALTACAPLTLPPPTPSPEEQALRRARAKIAFDLNEIDENGLIGPAGDKRSVAYEFCIPREQENLDEVRAIDPSLQCYAESRGRIGCTRDQYLCIGQGGTRETLLKLASLDYVERIEPFYGE
ncbi:MAG: hypothetical protein KatS3mg053_0867 [Candidatus Roseilinea sp.]|nr:MAG: hypothetical protein KatS3mg053_0867 [Candidatus Roseilinea sp.]